MQIIDYPTPINATEYQALVNKIVAELCKNCEPVSIYQLGSVNHPGISDLDVLCVFSERTKCSFNINEFLNPNEKKMLTHQLFGTTEIDQKLSLIYNHFTNFNLVYGKNLLIEQKAATANELKTQIALEFMLKFFISLDIQVKYDIIKIRSFLLSAKALQYDVELLQLHDSNLHSMVKQVIAWRDQWFQQTPGPEEIIPFIKRFHKELFAELKVQMSKHTFYIPQKELKIAGNIFIKQSAQFSVSHSGFKLPGIFSAFGKRYFNLQNRFNKFVYHIPFELPNNGDIISKRFDFYKRTLTYNNEWLPHFMPLTTGLRLFYN